MAYELRVTRGSSAIDPGTRPITETELRLAFAAAGMELEEPATGEDAWWVRYPHASHPAMGGTLFCRAALDAGIAILSISYSSARVMRNALHAFKLACSLAERLGATAFEPAETDITPPTAKLSVRAPGGETNITYEGGRDLWAERAAGGKNRSDSVLRQDMFASLVEANSPWRTAILEAHHLAIARVDGRPTAALEVPVGGLDIVPDYAFFRAWPQRPVSLEALEARLRDDGFATIVDLPVMFVLTDATDTPPWMAGFDRRQTPGAQALRRQDGHWQVRPNHGRVPWPVIARTALAVVRAVRELGGGTIGITGLVFDETLEREAEALCRRSGVEFFAWALRHDAAMELARADEAARVIVSNVDEPPAEATVPAVDEDRVEVDHRLLLRATTKCARTALESALARCVERRNRELTMGHVVAGMLAVYECDYARTLATMGIRRAEVGWALAAHLASLPVGATGKPTIARAVVLALQDAWRELDPADEIRRIRTGAIVSKLFENPARYRAEALVEVLRAAGAVVTPAALAPDQRLAWLEEHESRLPAPNVTPPKNDPRGRVFDPDLN